MLIAINGNYGYLDRNVYCHISYVNAIGCDHIDSYDWKSYVVFWIHWGDSAKGISYWYVYPFLAYHLEGNGNDFTMSLCTLGLMSIICHTLIFKTQKKKKKDKIMGKVGKTPQIDCLVCKHLDKTDIKLIRMHNN